MRTTSVTPMPARQDRLIPLHGVRGIPRENSSVANPPRPTHTGFTSLVAEIVLGKWELEYERLYSQPLCPTKSSIAGKYQYRCGTYIDELYVLGEIFRWNKGGWLISAPVKSEEEWLAWINQL